MAAQSLPTHSDLLFHYDRPTYAGRKTDVAICRTDFATMQGQVLSAADNTNLHSHVHSYGFWFVLAGHLRFYTTGDEFIADAGPEEGVVIPPGFPYRYEVLPDQSDGFVEAFRFGANDVAMATSNDDRLNLEPLRPGQDPILGGAGPLSGDIPAVSPFPTPQKFTYVRPQVEVRKVEILALTDRGVFGFQVLRSGGEISMHSHPHLDGFWFVRRGTARFYTIGDKGDEVLAELGPNEGVLIPKGFPYSFEAVVSGPDDECELMQMECADIAISGKREELTADVVHYEPSNFGQPQR